RSAPYTACPAATGRLLPRRMRALRLRSLRGCARTLRSGAARLAGAADASEERRLLNDTHGAIAELAIPAGAALFAQQMSQRLADIADRIRGRLRIRRRLC